MAQFFKRRTKAGPSKNEQKVARARENADRARSASSLKDQFPGVDRLRVHLEFLSPQQQPLDQQTREFDPGDTLDLAAPCPGRCGSGRFDLAGKLQAMVESRQAAAEASGTCQEAPYAGATEACGVKLRCRIEVVYAPVQA